MATMTQKRQRARIRAKISGTPQRPRLVVTISNRHIVAQLVDDTKGQTLGYVSTVNSNAKGNLTAKAAWVGEQIAGQAKEHKIKQVVFDRAGRIYHGRLDAMASAARQKGLEF
jgi:large subunit ribosomal protein L18